MHVHISCSRLFNGSLLLLASPTVSSLSLFSLSSPSKILISSLKVENLEVEREQQQQQLKKKKEGESRLYWTQKRIKFGIFDFSTQNHQYLFLLSLSLPISIYVFFQRTKKLLPSSFSANNPIAVPVPACIVQGESNEGFSYVNCGILSFF